MSERRQSQRQSKKREREKEEEEESDCASDQEIDEELRLPDDLAGISNKERKELFQFKRKHTEIEYEHEVMRRIELLQPKKDLERLKRMTEGTNKPEIIAAKKITRKAPKVRETKKNRISVEEDDDEEEEKNQEIFGVSEGEVSEGKESDDEEYHSPSEDDDDDLFGEDEINEIVATRQVPRKSTVIDDNDEMEDGEDEKAKAPKTRLQKSKGRTPAKPKDKRSALDRYEEEYNEDNEEEEAKDKSEESDYGDDDQKKESKMKETKTSETNKDVPERDDSTLAELTDYQRIQTRRMFIDKWISEPFFDEVVKGSFVRLFVGLQDGNHVYRMCEVLDVLPYKRPYRLPGTDITVDRALLVGLGSSQKVAKMYHVSNSRISEKEYQFYLNTMKACREEEKLLRKSAIEKRRKKISDTLHHTYTNGEIQAMVEKNGAKNKALTTNNANALKILEKRLSTAREEEDFDEMEKLQKDIEKITREINLSKQLYAKNYGILTDLNKRNRAANTELDMQAGERRRQQEQERGGGEKNTINPFGRRDTRPQILWVTGKKKEKESQPPPEPEKTPLLQSIGPVEDDFSTEVEINPEQIGRRIQDRYGFNPYIASMKSRKERYLLEVCRDLPPMGEARETFRSGLSLAKYRSMCEEEDS